MSAISNSTERWTPASAADREMVLQELDSILSSHLFRGSKRYPALLKYVVDGALEGRAGDLKERTLGVEVFGRDPNYDTSANPVVRFSAGEVRKRIAQFYHENGHGSRVQIELPLGSYVPEFLLRMPEVLERQTDSGSRKSVSTQLQRPEDLHPYRKTVLSAIALLVVAAAVGTYTYLKASTARNAVIDKFWAPLVKPVQPVLIVVGTGHNGKQQIPETAETTFYDHMTGPNHHVSIAAATALANIAGVLRQHGTAYEIKEDNETSLTDMHSRTLILIGATNNTWTMRLLSPLRFHFTPGPMAQILDAKNLPNSDWEIDFSKPFSSVSTDYGIVARYYDRTTEGPVMVIAGIGPYGTEAASAFVASPQYLEQIDKQGPTGWENKNLEMVLKSAVIEGKAGPPVLLSSTVW